MCDLFEVALKSFIYFFLFIDTKMDRKDKLFVINEVSLDNNSSILGTRFRNKIFCNIKDSSFKQ